MRDIVTEMEAKLIQAGRVLNLYKELSETPRERLERLRMQRTEYEHEVLSYAGRLDPMAEGVLICLVGSANKMRDAYLDMSKEYTLEVLFGFSTDTYDILGRVMESADIQGLTRAGLNEAINEFRGTVSQEYPPYSSKTVEGKPLFAWARGNDLGTMVLPRRDITVYDIEITGMYKFKEQALFQYIERAVMKVQGDFRQEEVLRGWKKVLKEKGTREFPCATIRISCSSGTYARSIAHGLGSRLGMPSLSLHIFRTKVGEYTIEDSLR